MPNSSDADKLSGLFLARRRRRSSADLLVKNRTGDAAPLVFGDWLFDEVVSGGPVDATLAVTDSADTLTGAGDLSTSAAGAVSDAADTLAAQAQAAFDVTAALSDAADTLTGEASVGAAGVDAALSVTDEADSLTGAGGVAFDAAQSAADAPDTLDALADVGLAGVTAQLAIVDADDTLTAAEITTDNGALVVTDGVDTLFAIGQTSDFGTASLFDEDDTLNGLFSMGASEAPASLGGRFKPWLFDIPTWTIDVDAAMRDDEDHVFAAAVVRQIIAAAVAAVEPAKIAEVEKPKYVAELKRTPRTLRRSTHES